MGEKRGREDSMKSQSQEKSGKKAGAAAGSFKRLEGAPDSVASWRRHLWLSEFLSED